MVVHARNYTGLDWSNKYGIKWMDLSSIYENERTEFDELEMIAGKGKKTRMTPRFLA